MAINLNYLWPATGAVAPTALQVADEVVVDVEATADGDGDAAITHNLGLSAADLAVGKPLITLMIGAGVVANAAAARLSNWLITAIAANTITVTKVAGAGGSGAAGAQLRVSIKRPHSIGR